MTVERNWGDISEDDFPTKAVSRIDSELFKAALCYTGGFPREDGYLVSEHLLWAVVNTLDCFGYRITPKS